MRIPLSGTYNTRISKSNAPAGTSGVWGIGIWGLFVWGGSGSQATDKDERYINCLSLNMGQRPDGSARNYIVKRPGYAVANTPASGNVGSAILIWTGKSPGTDVITAFGASNSTIYNGTTSLGAITGKATWITETFVSTTATLLISSNDSTGWYYDTGVGVPTKIADADFPGNAGLTLAGTFAHMDGYAFIMTTDAAIWNSDLNTVISWAGASFQSANAYPDKGVGLMRYKNLIVAFGSESMQFFYNAGQNPTGSPLQRIDSLTVKVGAISADAIGQISDIIFFVGSTAQGGCTVYKYDGAIKRISNPEQDFQLLMAGPSNINVTTCTRYGRSFVLVNANATTYSYCLETGKWNEETATTPLWYKCAGLSLGNQVLTYAISKYSTSGKVYVINPAALVFTDDGVAFTATIQAPNIRIGKRMTYPVLEVICDREPSTSSLVISFSDDDAQTFTTHSTVDLSQPRPRATRLGSSYDRTWKFTNSSNEQMRIEAFDLPRTA